MGGGRLKIGSHRQGVMDIAADGGKKNAGFGG